MYCSRWWRNRFYDLKKVFVSFVENAGMSYNIQEAFNAEGYFSIKVSHLGANLCFLVELEVVEIEYIINEVSE